MISGIGEKTIEAIRMQVDDLIEAHKRNVQSAFMKTEDRKIKIAFSCNIEAKGDGLAIETGITYTVEKVSDKQSAFIKENQPGLFAVEPSQVAAS